VAWYLAHRQWIDFVRSGEYLRWIETHYGATGGTTKR
jgi:dTDP-glucose 4,6-dehydratase